MRLFEFAIVADWDSRLASLAAMAEEERWTFLHVPARSPLPILDSYIQYTFERVHQQGRIVITERLACFNTGLLTPSQEEIFAVFIISQFFNPEMQVGSANKMWYLQGWYRASERWLTEFKALPPLASYWSDPGSLIFNPAFDVQLNIDHIIRDNLTRFPEEFGGKLDKDGVPHDLVDQDFREADEEQGVVAAPQPVQAVPLITRNALEGAIKHSIRLAHRSYRVAVPQFHQGQLQLLLPLYMRDATRADLALTLEPVGNWYRAATVLYMDWAYRHARLLSRPNSEWLGGFRADLVLKNPGI